MARAARVTRFLLTAPPLTVLWSVAAPLAFSRSSVTVLLVALGCGWLAAFWLGCVAAGWIPAPPARSVVYTRPYDPYAAERVHQQHLHDQARAAYLTNPESQPPPPTDYYPGF